MPEEVVKIPLNTFTNAPNLRYFMLSEFDSPDEPGSGKNMNVGFLKLLDQLRHVCGFPFTITSGYRTPAHNQSLKDGGRKSVDDSAHTKGFAADIATDSSWARITIVKTALDLGINRIGVGKNFVHVDVDPEKPKDVMWLYG